MKFSKLKQFRFGHWEDFYQDKPNGSFEIAYRPKLINKLVILFMFLIHTELPQNME